VAAGSPAALLRGAGMQGWQLQAAAGLQPCLHPIDAQCKHLHQVGATRTPRCAGYDEEARYFERGVSEAKREELVEALDVSGWQHGGAGGMCTGGRCWV